MQRTQGTPKSMLFDPITSDFTCTFVLNTSITAPTVVFLSEEYYYSNGLVTKIRTPQGEVIETPIDYTSNFLTFTISDETLNGQTISVEITSAT